jgi:hypothetical protein
MLSKVSICLCIIMRLVPRGNVVSWVTVLQAGRSRVRDPVSSMNLFSIYLISPTLLGPASTQPLTAMSTRSRKICFWGRRARPVRKADNLMAIFEPIVKTMWDPQRL